MTRRALIGVEKKTVHLQLRGWKKAIRTVSSRYIHRQDHLHRPARTAIDGISQDLGTNRSSAAMEMRIGEQSSGPCRYYSPPLAHGRWRSQVWQAWRL
jgi:hypothetical protein